MGTVFLKVVDVAEIDGTKKPVFVCDPQRHTRCKKKNCGEFCQCTTEPEFARRFEETEGNYIYKS